jgi:hypothetical protein
MADAKISALTSASTPLTGTEVLPLVQSSTTKKTTVASLFASGSVVKVSTAIYAPNSIVNLYTGTNSDALYYNSAFDQTVSVTAGNTLVVVAMGGGLDVSTGSGNSFVPFLQIDGSDYQCGQIYYNAGSGTIAVQAAKASLSSSSVTVKFGGFSRYDSRTPTLDLRNAVSNEGGGNGALGGQFRWTFIEVKA